MAQAHELKTESTKPTKYAKTISKYYNSSYKSTSNLRNPNIYIYIYVFKCNEHLMPKRWDPQSSDPEPEGICIVCNLRTNYDFGNIICVCRFKAASSSQPSANAVVRYDERGELVDEVLKAKQAGLEIGTYVTPSATYTHMCKNMRTPKQNRGCLRKDNIKQKHVC